MPGGRCCSNATVPDDRNGRSPGFRSRDADPPPDPVVDRVGKQQRKVGAGRDTRRQSEDDSGARIRHHVVWPFARRRRHPSPKMFDVVFEPLEPVFHFPDVCSPDHDPSHFLWFFATGTTRSRLSGTGATSSSRPSGESVAPRTSPPLQAQDHVNEIPGLCKVSQSARPDPEPLFPVRWTPGGNASRQPHALRRSIN